MASARSDSSSSDDNNSAAESRSPTPSAVARVGQRRVLAPPPTNPPPSLSSDRPLSPIRPRSPMGSIGMWVTPAEAGHARTLARVAAEQSARLKLLEARLHLSEDREGAAADMSYMLSERVADLSELASERGLAYARAWTLIQILVAALVLALAFVVILAFK